MKTASVTTSLPNRKHFRVSNIYKLLIFVEIKTMWFVFALRFPAVNVEIFDEKTIWDSFESNFLNFFSDPQKRIYKNLT